MLRKIILLPVIPHVTTSSWWYGKVLHIPHVTTSSWWYGNVSGGRCTYWYDSLLSLIPSFFCVPFRITGYGFRGKYLSC
jgi:hypothetical protein